MQFPVETDTGSGERLHLLGIEEDDHGEYLAIEGHLEPGVGPPMHVHFGQDEGVRVEDGVIGYTVLDPSGEERSGQVGPGEEIRFLSGQFHRFWNDGDTPARITGWVRPPGNFPWYISRVHESLRNNGGERPGFFDGAFLSWRYRHEFQLAEIPIPVVRYVFPVVVGLGTLLGRYRKYRDAPASPAGAPGPSGAR